MASPLASRRALRVHVAAAVVVPGCLALTWWQATRAAGGNTLSWAYTFEWPLFAAYAVYMWWRLVHEGAEDTPPPAPNTGAPGGRTSAAGPEPAAHPEVEQEDAELAAYNAYLAQLAERDRAAEG